MKNLLSCLAFIVLGLPLLSTETGQVGEVLHGTIYQRKGLLKSWPTGGPKKEWMTDDAGLGYAGFSVSNGALYTMGAFGGTEKLIAYRATSDSSSNKKVWALEVGDLLTNGWGDGPRTTPRFPMEKFMLWAAKETWSMDAKTGKKVGKSIWLRTLEGKYQIGDIPNLY